MDMTTTITTVLDHIHRCLPSNLLLNNNKKLSSCALSTECSVTPVLMTITQLEMLKLPVLPLASAATTVPLRTCWVCSSYRYHIVKVSCSQTVLSPRPTRAYNQLYSSKNFYSSIKQGSTHKRHAHRHTHTSNKSYGINNAPAVPDVSI